jgi:hypothetical protein
LDFAGVFWAQSREPSIVFAQCLLGKGEVRSRVENVPWYGCSEVSFVFVRKNLRHVASASAVALKASRSLRRALRARRRSCWQRSLRRRLSWRQSGCFATACCVFAVFEICLLWRTRKSWEGETTQYDCIATCNTSLPAPRIASFSRCNSRAISARRRNGPSVCLLAAALRQTPPSALACGLLGYIAARNPRRSAELVWPSPTARGVSSMHRQGPPSVFVPWRAPCSPGDPRRRRSEGCYTAT